jgi:hypothetical protein
MPVIIHFEEADEPKKKMSKDLANYRKAAVANVRCAICAHFIHESSTCEIVEGDINTNWTCDHFSRTRPMPR